jgi:hypothetical protein
MKDNVALTITSSLSVLLFALHVSDDIVRGFEPGGFKNVSGILMATAWLYGTLALSGRRSGFVLMLLGNLLGTVLPLAHMRGAGLVGGRIATSEGQLFFVATLIVLGITATFSVILAARGLWSTRRHRAVTPAAHV